MKVCLIHPAIGEFSFPVERAGNVIIGRRGPSVDVELTWDPRVSRRHAQLWVQDGEIWFEDLNSRNGSWQGESRLNGPLRLEPGASIILGETALVIRAHDTADTTIRSVEQTHEHTPLSIATLGAALAIPSEVTSTTDLRSSQDLGRSRPRLTEAGVVEVLLFSRDDLSELWARDLSKGGLFVETPAAPPQGSTVDIHLATPEGGLPLRGQVVHVVSPESARQYGIPPGMGLQLLDLGPVKRGLIQAYLDGPATALGEAQPTTEAAPAVDNEALLGRVKKFLAHAEQNALYAALDLAGNASQKQVDQRVEELRTHLQEALPRMTPPQAARVEAALTVLERVKRVLGSPESRLEYDFRHGQVRAPERIAQAAAKNGLPLTVLRRAWNRVWPDRVDRAAFLTRTAFSARQSRDLRGAIKAGKQALDLNPFFDELRKTVETWEAMAARGEDDADVTQLPRRGGPEPLPQGSKR